MINPKLLTFLRNIKKNNNKEWFDAHRSAYTSYRAEFATLLAKLRDEVMKVDDSLAHSHKSGIETIKIFRINRDTRFSKDKTTYKTGISGLISADPSNPREPVYYLAIEPHNKSFVGGGIRTPEPGHLETLRTYISTHPKECNDVSTHRLLRKRFPEGFSQEFVLKTSPRGYDAHHPAIAYLKLKNFTVGATLPDKTLQEKTFIKDVASALTALTPLNEFLRKASR